MPKELRYFGCDHANQGCSRKPLKTKSRMVNHELICWFNPTNQTCATCGFSSYERIYIDGIMPDGTVGGEYGDYERECLHPDGNKLPAGLEKAGPHVRPALNCPSWKHRDEVECEGAYPMGRMLDKK